MRRGSHSAAPAAQRAGPAAARTSIRRFRRQRPSRSGSTGQHHSPGLRTSDQPPIARGMAQIGRTCNHDSFAEEDALVVTAGQAYITPAARAAVEAERVRLEARLLEVS